MMDVLVGAHTKAMSGPILRKALSEKLGLALTSSELRRIRRDKAGVLREIAGQLSATSRPFDGAKSDRGQKERSPVSRDPPPSDYALTKRNSFWLGMTGDEHPLAPPQEWHRHRSTRTKYIVLAFVSIMVTAVTKLLFVDLPPSNAPSILFEVWMPVVKVAALLFLAVGLLVLSVTCYFAYKCNSEWRKLYAGDRITRKAAIDLVIFNIPGICSFYTIFYLLVLNAQFLMFPPFLVYVIAMPLFIVAWALATRAAMQDRVRIITPEGGVIFRWPIWVTILDQVGEFLQIGLFVLAVFWLFFFVYLGLYSNSIPVIGFLSLFIGLNLPAVALLLAAYAAIASLDRVDTIKKSYSEWMCGLEELNSSLSELSDHSYDGVRRATAALRHAMDDSSEYIKILQNAVAKPRNDGALARSWSEASTEFRQVDGDISIACYDLSRLLARNFEWHHRNPTSELPGNLYAAAVGRIKQAVDAYAERLAAPAVTQPSSWGTGGSQLRPRGGHDEPVSGGPDQTSVPQPASGGR